MSGIRDQAEKIRERLALQKAAQACRPDAPRRLAILWLGRHEFVTLLTGWGASGKFLRPVAPQLPADAELVDVCWDWQRDAFGLKFQHPSFPTHQEGAPIPWIGRLEVELQEEAPRP